MKRHSNKKPLIILAVLLIVVICSHYIPIKTADNECFGDVRFSLIKGEYSEFKRESTVDEENLPNINIACIQGDKKLYLL